MKLLMLRLFPGTKPNLVRVEVEGSGEYNHEFELPYDTDQLWGVGNLLAATDDKLNSDEPNFKDFRESTEIDWMIKEKLLTEITREERKFISRIDIQKKIGEKLFKAIFGGAIKNVLIKNDQIDILHIQIYIDARIHYHIHDYPWELVFDGDHFLQSKKVTFSRYINFGTTPPKRDKLPSNKPLKVLLVSSAAYDLKNGLGKLSSKEKEALQKLAKENPDHIILETLSSGTYEDFEKYLTEHKGENAPHVIHFDGHGFFGKVCPNCKTVHKSIASGSCNKPCNESILDDPEGYLVFEHNGNQKKPHYVSRVDLGSLLGDQTELRLVVLSACQSAWSRYSNSVFNGIAQNLISQGVPAVVAMQYPVKVDSAIYFVKSFYKSLTEKNSLPRAMYKGRQNMKFTDNQWYRPVLYLRWADNHGGQLFEEPEPVVEKKPEVEIDWHGICRDRLTSQINQMKTPLTTGGHSPLPNSPDNTYIELNLVQRDPNKTYPRPQVQSVSPSEGVQHNLANEVSREYTHKEFFEEVLSNPDSLKKNGRPQLAIVGEPGSGKTTLLLRIAQWLLEKKKGFPIWISLKEIPANFPTWSQKTGGLNHYLSEIWLKAAVNKNKTEEEWNNTKGKYQQALNELLASGKAWLFLDGANEIYGNDVIVKINNELGETTWTQVPVVLNCRLNEWEFSTNQFISNSWVCRILPYNDTQVCEYIGKRLNDNVEKKDLLVRQINNHQRLKNLAKNPLCLAMLCFVWEQKQFDLSSITKAKLYQEFECEYNELKVCSNITPQTIKDIRQILGNLEPMENLTPGKQKKLLKCIRTKLVDLSLEAMKQKDSPFLLSPGFLNKLFDGNEELLELLKHWGWLNNSGEGNCFTFFHPSFQEYFASQAIDDWDYFIPKEHTEEQANIKIPPKNPDGGDGDYKPYRIFESKWKEVILLWIGREVDNAAFRTKKEKFIEHLVNFQDGWENFYGYRAYFLAAVGISEFSDFQPSDNDEIDNEITKEDIVNQVVNWSVGNFQFRLSPKKTFIDPIIEEAIATLLEMEYHMVRNALQDIIQSNNSETEIYRRKAAENLLKLDPNNNIALNTLQNVNPSSQMTPTHQPVAQDSVETTIHQIVEIAKPLSPDSPVLWRAIERLGEIQTESSATIQTENNLAIQFLRDCLPPEITNLGEVGNSNPKELKVLLSHLLPLLKRFGINRDNFDSFIDFVPAITKLGEVDKINPYLLPLLKQFGINLDNFDSLRIHLIVPAKFVKKLSPESRQFIKSIIWPPKDRYIFWKAVYHLGNIFSRNTQNGGELEDILRKIFTTISAKSLAEIAELVKHLRFSEGDREQGIKQLVDKVPRQWFSIVVILLKDYLEDTSSPQTLDPSLQSQESKLERLDLLTYVDGQSDSERFRDCYKTLWYCAQVMPYPEFYSAFNPESNSNE